MKKWIAILLSLTMALSLAACAKAPAEDVENPPAEEAQQPQGEPDHGETETPEAEEPAPAEQNPAEQDPAEQDPAEQDPAEQDPAEQGPAEQGPEEQDPAVADLLEKLEALVEGVNSEMAVENMEIPADQYEYQLFIDYVEGSHAVTSMAMINAIAHSVCLLQLPEDADAEAVSQEIETNMDPRKWICVEAEATAVRTSGQYVLMVMSDQASVDTILANFDTVFGA